MEQWTFDGYQLHGDVYGHPRFPDGTYVHTSAVVGEPVERKEGDLVETLNTVYVLGTPFDPAVFIS
jgi:hypothetical protein